VSVATGLSISSIATDKKVGAGGPYYIVSRSLGLPIGGTLGLALFLGLSFSISLYIIGFSESFLGTIDVEATPTAIRICGTITLVVLTVITFISTALAIKTQYLILSLIALSLFAIFFGSPDNPATEVHTEALPDSPSLAVLFGIFFPAVTGFTAGVNMSGDLRDPKGAIPTGTLLSISTGFVVYAGLAVYLAVRVPPEVLVGDYDALQKIALWGPFVVAGIWGATLSSALGSILGAPRILQATAVDRITPRIFARGYGKANEPRNALVLACAIGWAGILIAELDAIARIVSMVFLATYGFLNISAAIESWVSPDFRPSFRVPRFVSVVGASAAVLLMIQLDLLAMAGAVVAMGGLYAYLQRRQLALESGDAWDGIWTSLVRTGLYRLRNRDLQQRNWRPNILVFARHGSDDRSALRGLASTLISGTGMATEFEVYPPGADVDADEDDDPDEVGFFRREVEAEDFYGTVAGITVHHGFGSVEPNTVLLDWSAWRVDPARFRALLDRIHRRDYNLLLYAPEHERELNAGKRRVDVWWRVGAGNLPLCISLVRFVTRAPDWRNADVRFLLLADEEVSGDYLRSETYRALDERRVGGAVKVIHSTSGEDDFAERARAESEDADLVILGLPRAIDETFLERVDDLARQVGDVLFFRAESAFEPILKTERTGEPTQEVPLGLDLDRDVQPLQKPAPKALDDAAQLFADHHDDLVHELDKRGLAPLYERDLALIQEIEALVDKHFDTLEKRLGATHAGKQDNVVNRVQSAFLLDAERLLSGFEEKDLVEQRSRLEARRDAFLVEGAFRPMPLLRVERPKADFATRSSDPAHVRAFKRRRRVAGWLRRRHGYVIKLDGLLAHYRERAADEILLAALEQFQTDSHALAVQVGKLLNASKTSLTLLGDGFDAAAVRDEFVREQRRAALEKIHALRDDHERRRQRLRHATFVASRRISQLYADDIDRLDVARLVKRDRKVDLRARDVRGRLAELPDAWSSAQTMLIGRAKLGLLVSTFQHRLATLVQRTRDTVARELAAGARSTLEDVHGQLDRWLGAKTATPAGLRFSPDVEKRFDPKPIVDHVVRESATLAAGLPTATTTLSDETIRELTLGQCSEIETRKVSARGVAELLLETEFVSHVQRELEAATALEERALSVASDVARLVAFNLEEAEPLGPGAFREQMTSVVQSAAERIGVELTRLRALGPRLDAFLVERLQRVLEGTDPYELTRSSDNLTREFRKVEGKKAIHGLRGRLAAAFASVRRLMVYVLYRRSVGVLYARRLQDRATARGPTVDRLTALVEGARPKPDVLEALPFFYRQLFLGQSSVNKSFWVERPEQLERGREAIARHRAGAHGAIVVTGERLAGKSAFLHRLARHALGDREVAWVHPLPSGSARPADFERALREATRREGRVDDVLRELPDGAVVFIDDLELWWERTSGGLAVLDVIFDAIAKHGDRVLFVVGIGTAAFRLVDRLRPLAGDAVAVIDCGPVSAEELKSIVELRHGSAGMRFELDAVDEGDLSQWALARLFSKHFDYAGGCVGAALRAWVANIDEVRDKTLVIEPPEPRNWEVLDELRVEWKALLLQLTLHKRLGRDALERVTGADAATLERDVGALRRAGLIVEDRDGVIEVDPYLHHALTDRFVRGGLLA
jgi:amino acid transporter